MDSRKRVSPPAIADQPLALYVHIPFCETKCPYCDFNTYSGIESLVPDYIAGLESEIRSWGCLLERPPIATIFFGGGTPSYLPAEDITGLLGVIRESFTPNVEPEITIECNPGDIYPAKLSTYREAGVNRVSMGVQSLDDGLLSLLGRRHDSRAAVESVDAVRKAGFENLSLDLMFGLPHQTLEQWRKTLERSLELATPHVSLYSLTLEPNTPLEASVARGELPEPDPDLAADMYLLACELLEIRGYGHYEISNWAKPRYEAKHNLAYWLSKPYLGVGPGAHSYLRTSSGVQRFENLKSPRKYIECTTSLGPIEQIDSPVDFMHRNGPVSVVEKASDAQDLSDYLMMGLRLSSGVSLNSIATRFNIDLFDSKGPELNDLIASGLLIFEGGTIRIPHDRWLVGNEVFLRLAKTPETTRT